MSTTQIPLNPEFIAVCCESTYTGAVSWVLTSCTEKGKMYNICRKVSKELREDLGTVVEFTRYTLKELVHDMEDSLFLGEIRDGDHEGFDDVDVNLLYPAELLKSENIGLFYRVLEKHFDTGYENGVIKGYIASYGVSVIMAS